MTKYYSNILAKQNQQPRTSQQVQPEGNAHKDKRQKLELDRSGFQTLFTNHHKN
uniref:Uncharacterized protein n=1 Tax=Arion vulgaris TaxID=1028688 RepID=A0A0B7B885_9EUPU